MSNPSRKLANAQMQYLSSPNGTSFVHWIRNASPTWCDVNEYLMEEIASTLKPGETPGGNTEHWVGDVNSKGLLIARMYRECEIQH